MSYEDEMRRQMEQKAVAEQLGIPLSLGHEFKSARKRANKRTVRLAAMKKKLDTLPKIR